VQIFSITITVIKMYAEALNFTTGRFAVFIWVRTFWAYFSYCIRY